MSNQLTIPFGSKIVKEIEFTLYKSGTTEFLNCSVLGFYCYINIKHYTHPNVTKYETNARKGLKPFVAKEFETMQEAQLEFCKILTLEVSAELNTQIEFKLKQNP